LKGKLIIFEGPDFSGKSTQVKKLMSELKGTRILYTREPGSYLPESSYYCEEIRNKILNNNLTPLQEAELFAESRYEHTKEMIKYLNDGFNILCDRYIISSLAYQGYAQDVGKDAIYELNKDTINLLEENLLPIYAFRFLLEQEEWEKRKEERLKKEAADSIESKNIYDKVFEFYNNDSIYYDYTNRLNIFTHTVDANKSIYDLSKYIYDMVQVLVK
jgi:dTMP kinase